MGLPTVKLSLDAQGCDIALSRGADPDGLLDRQGSASSGDCGSLGLVERKPVLEGDRPAALKEVAGVSGEDRGELGAGVLVVARVPV